MVCLSLLTSVWFVMVIGCIWRFNCIIYDVKEVEWWQNVYIVTVNAHGKRKVTIMVCSLISVLLMLCYCEDLWCALRGTGMWEGVFPLWSGVFCGGKYQMSVNFFDFIVLSLISTYFISLLMVEFLILYLS